MNKAILLRTLAGALVTAAQLGAPALATMTPDEIKRLEFTLTPVGAERTANKDSSIPAWSGKWQGAPTGTAFRPGEPYPDSYAAEKPVTTITAQNMEQYRAHLSDGQLAMFRLYPATFRMMIYPSHRDFRYGDAIYKAIHDYAPKTQMTADANGLKEYPPTAPFPVPKNGLELMWNLRFSSAIAEEAAVYDQAVVYRDGKTAWGKWKYDIWSPVNIVASDKRSTLIDRTFARVETELPLRERGNIIVSQSFWDREGSDTARTWQYNPGTRRVRQAPEFGFDQPLGPGGFRTVDDDRLFNGSGERYEWKIVGKKEIYIPYHNYKLADPAVKYAELLSANHPSPDYVRYELHRVWVLEATLKQGFRHQYAKRVLYLDEDTWMAVLADNYDARGQLWRTNMQSSFYAYDIKRYYPAAAFYHDLIAGSYLADRLTNEGKPVRLNSSPQFNEAYFSPDSIRSAGH
ncbi:DUF1329 domain-containing protein [Cupriavidus pinatubonensis]|uniref:DUF1329 domain-containing protein n=1 Tax=Cupriavidus pinatubonensis TaxID=248026 RepID=UPI00112BFA7B|nr:DUF1329 domain-containing protein [Cupriavidus pinatubonensis]TPQ38791.1 DUF1329 domain-containing protein [Cupriavidus pinatubonensis]